jgi:uncharacterized damage-inducible protein DinB
MVDRTFPVMARYTAWANGRLLDACAALPPEDYAAARPSFFGSIHATLNHLLAMDRVWLGRISGEGHDIPAPDHILCPDLPSLRVARPAEDARLVRIIDGLPPARLDEILHYTSMAGAPQAMPLRFVLAHLFNHHAHHRGQIHDMLSQTAVAPPALDLTYFPIPTIA